MDYSGLLALGLVGIVPQIMKFDEVSKLPMLRQLQFFVVMNLPFILYVNLLYIKGEIIF